MRMNKESVSPRAYYDFISDTYDAIFLDPISRAEDAVVKAMLKERLKPGVRVLDCGCGTGLGRTLTSAITQDYVGVDLSEEMIKRARQKHAHGVFHVGDMARMDFLEDESFDCVMALHGAFSHVPDDRRAAAEMMRVLRPGGVLLVMVYSRYSLTRLRRLRQNGFCRGEGVYSVRNAASDRAAWARFYTPGDLKRRFPGLEAARICPLNIFPDNLRRRGEVRDLMSVMAFEARLPRILHGLAHALILTGVKR